jgi:3-dehydroquinate synthase
MSQALYRIRVPVDRAQVGYEIVVGEGIVASLPSLVARCCPAHHYAIITDSTVGELYATRLVRALNASGHRAEVFVFPAGEERKTRSSWAALSDAMLEAGLGRDAAVVALGGGVVGDLAGFVAATYMRGIPIVQVPTTLLAMIDASVGGKAGVNTPTGKNLIGAFWPPKVVVIDPQVLETLPMPQLRAGFAEVVKHAAIADEAHFRELEGFGEQLLAGESELLSRIIVRSVEIKAETVARDELESGPRKVLNFGHTIAHAIEALAGYQLLHGDAVAIGMVVESRIGERLGITQAGATERIRSLLAALGLPTAVPPNTSAQAICEKVRIDKKARAGRAEMTLLRAIGAVDDAGGRWSHPVSDELVRECLNGRS